MNIERENTGELSATLKISIKPEDYKEKVNKALKDYQKKASFKGFRPGKVPTSLIQKLYGKSILAEEVNTMLGEALSNYLKENNVNILGQPLPNEEKNKSVDFESQKEFDFFFDIGLSPDAELNLSESTEVIQYDIEVDDIMVEKEIGYMRGRFGTYPTAEISEDKDMVHGAFEELDGEGKLKDKGINHHSNVSLEHAKNELMKAKLIGVKKEDKIVFKAEELLQNEDEAAYYLGVKKEELVNIKSDFQFTVEEINRIELAELNEDFYKKVFPTSNITDKEGFEAKVKESLKESLQKESDTRLNEDIVDHLLAHTNIPLPEEFLKRWLKETNEKLTEEEIDKNFHEYMKFFKWEIMESKLIKDNNLEVGEEEIKAYARTHAKNQLLSYGLPEEHITEDYLEKFSADMLKKEDSIRKIYDNLYNQKVMAHIKSKIKLINTNISLDEFIKLEKGHKHEHNHSE